MAQVHKLIAKAAKEFAGAFYEFAAHDDHFYRYYPSQKAFIQREWPRFTPKVREVFGSMLGRPDISEHMKQEIFDALTKDKAINAPAEHVRKAHADGTMFH